jgi:hypothetical protein
VIHTGGNVSKKKRLLFLQPAARPYSKDPELNMFYYMSEVFEGDAICIDSRPYAGDMDSVEEINASLPSFNYYVKKRSRLPRVFGMIFESFYYLWKGISLRLKNGKYDVIV